jgi:hypothetical protein
LLHWVMNAPLGWTKSYQCMLWSLYSILQSRP